MPVEIKPSSPQFTEIDAHLYALNVLVNPQLFFDVQELPDSPENKALKEIILSQIQQVIEE